MKRIMVIGCCGSGKSTFSKKLGKILGLKVIHLDQHYWQANWVETEKLKWEKIVKQLASQPEWIIDGNYGSTMDIRIKRADTIIYLDHSTINCLWRITKRIIKYKGQVRPDMPAGCEERFDLEFYHYVLTFNLIRRKGLLALFNKQKNDKKILKFKNDHETENYLKKLSAKN